MDMEICSNCLLRNDSDDCKFSFCNINFFKQKLFELVTNPNKNVKTISDTLKIDRKTFFRFSKNKLKLSPKQLINLARILQFIKFFNEKERINYLIIKSGFNNFRNFCNILRKNFKIDKNAFINLVINAKKGQKNEMYLKRKLLDNMN